MKKIAVMTSGGDAPGMNGAIRAVVRAGLAMGVEVLGVRWGYAGLIRGELVPLDARAVGGILRQGGTILGTARSEEFKTEPGIRHAMSVLADQGIEGLVVIGGDGSLRGALELHRRGVAVIGVPGSIDNDIACTERAIGFDTAVNTALEALDRLKDTASAHQRAFVVEVMGRSTGFLALAAGLAGGAEMVLVPEVPCNLGTVSQALRDAYLRGKPHFIVVVAEGSPIKSRDLFEYLQALRRQEGRIFEVRLTILGHVQRGGPPTAGDRILATRLGARAVELLQAGSSGRMVGLHADEIVDYDLDEVLRTPRKLDPRLYQLNQWMAL